VIVAASTVNRLPALQAAMTERNVDLVVVGPNANLRYVLGFEAMALERLTCLLVSASGAVMVLPDFDSAEFRAATGFDDVETWTDRGGPGGAVSSAFDHLRLPEDPITLIDEELPYRFLMAIRSRHRIREQGLAGEIIAELRLVKDAREQASMAVAGELVSVGVDTAVDKARPGMTELELKRLIEESLWVAGAESIECVLVQAGANAAAPHHNADNTPLRAGEPVLVDIAARVDGYYADITQQVYLGNPPSDYDRAYDTVHAAQEAGVRSAHAGASAHEIAAAASQVILQSEFARWNGPSTGHGIGMDVHEIPRVVEDNPLDLPAGSVITIEPGVYIPGRFGVRIEDTVLITEGEPRRLTRGSRPLTVSRP
jgi:Xaa-Pro aminopeptidase